MPVQDFTFKQNAKEITLVLVNVEVLVKAECPPKYYGFAGKEFSGDYSESTDRQRKSIELSIINSTLPQRVTSSKTEPFSSKPSLRKKLRKFKLINFKPNKMLEDKRT